MSFHTVNTADKPFHPLIYPALKCATFLYNRTTRIYWCDSLPRLVKQRGVKEMKKESERERDGERKKEREMET